MRSTYVASACYPRGVRSVGAVLDRAHGLLMEEGPDGRGPWRQEETAQV
jgi:hypothetical protein